jgi:hypothetical protein
VGSVRFRSRRRRMSHRAEVGSGYGGEHRNVNCDGGSRDQCGGPDDVLRSNRGRVSRRRPAARRPYGRRRRIEPDLPSRPRGCRTHPLYAGACCRPPSHLFPCHPGTWPQRGPQRHGKSTMGDQVEAHTARLRDALAGGITPSGIELMAKRIRRSWRHSRPDPQPGCGHCPTS